MESTRYDQFCSEQQKRADGHLKAFLDANPNAGVECSPTQWLKGTHLVTFGAFNGEPAVYKYYDGDPRKEYERRALALFEETALAPRVFAETDLMLIMQRLAGATVEETEKGLTGVDREKLYFDLGRSTARVVQAAPGDSTATRPDTPFRAADFADFYNTPFDALMALYRNADATGFFDVTVARSARALLERNVPQHERLKGSIEALQKNRDAILSRPSFVHMDDFHTNNIMSEGTRVTGFIDLEMTRSGNEVLFLGAVLSAMSRRPSLWPSFRRGYENARGKPLGEEMLHLLRVAAPFSRWIRFTWYWTTDDLPWWAKEANLGSSAVRDIVETLEAIERMDA